MDANERRLKELKLEKLRRSEAPSNNDEDPVEYLKALGLGFTQGATFDFADEIYGAVKSLGGGSYEKERDAARELFNKYADEYPITYYGANIGAGVASGELLGKGLSMIPKVGHLIPQAGTLRRTMGESALAGTGISEDDTAGGVAVDAALAAGAGGLVHGIGKVIKAPFKRPDEITATTYGADKKAMGEVGIKKREAVAKDLKKIGFYKLSPMKFDIENKKFIPDRNAHFNVKARPEENLIERANDALSQIRERVDSMLEKSDATVFFDDIENHPAFGKAVSRFIKAGTGRAERSSRLNSEIEKIASDINNGEFGSSLTYLNDYKRTLQKMAEDSYGRDVDASSFEAFYKDLAKVVRETVESKAGVVGKKAQKQIEMFDKTGAKKGLSSFKAGRDAKKFGEEIKALNSISQRIQTQLEDMKPSLAGKKVPYKIPIPIGVGRQYTAAKVSEKSASTPVAGNLRSTVGDIFNKIPTQYGEDMIKAAPARTMPRIDDEVDPDTGTYRRPQSLKSMIPDQTNIPKSIMKTKLPRTVDELLQNPEFLKAKLAQELNLSEQEVEDIMEDREGFEMWAESMAQIRPDLFIRDKYNSFNGKIQDPAMRQLAINDIHNKTDISNTDKIMAIHKVNTTGEIA